MTEQAPGSSDQAELQALENRLKSLSALTEGSLNACAETTMSTIQDEAERRAFRRGCGSSCRC
jgi:hypothetical protein